ncbi:alpha/beta hydrolase [Nocardioides sp. KR10-350]|uniref:alpha/beta hydrolase n=1 Tax=Nocardioides cheoyonin TaxID=3156615 RepID=UPI0032B3A1C5
MRRPLLTILAVLALAVLALALPLAPGGAHAATAKPKPGSPAYDVADARNMAAAYGRITGPGGQLRNPAYLPALVATGAVTNASQLLQQAATPTRLAITPGEVVPGWNVGNPLRAGWDGTRGEMKAVAFTNRYGALLRGHVYRPLPGARDPYTHERLRPPFPGVVITEGSVQGSEGMYEWLAQDLAERGYVVLTYDVQGQGTSETLPHDGPVDALPFCNPFAEPRDGETLGCPGVPSQQLSNFVVGTQDALGFFTSTPSRHYRNPKAAGAPVTAYNPYWRLFDRSPDRRTATPGRTTRIAIIGHSMGAAAVSKVQGTSKRVEAVVALDKLTGPDSPPPLDGTGNKPVVPALAVQSEYGFTVTPWELSGGSGLNPEPSPDGPDPVRERRTGYDDWRRAGKNTMLVVPRASTHLDYTDIPLVLPASRYGQDVASVYVQRWLGRYLKHDVSVGQILNPTLRYLEPVGDGVWKPVTLHRDRRLSGYYCSAYSLHADGGWRRSPDITGVGCR